MAVGSRAQGARVLYVTGKGGAGKSFVAELLATAAVAAGKRVALVEMSENGLAAATPNPDRGESTSTGLTRVVLDQRSALEHLLTRLLKLRFLSNRLMDSRTFSAVAAAAPGVKDLVYLSYLRDMILGATGRRLDLLVVDGFASGHTQSLLATPRRVLDLVRRGPAARLAREAADLVEGGSRLAAVVVSSPEELCVRETKSLLADLQRLRVVVSAVIVNGVYPARLDPEQAAWLRSSRASADALLHLGRRERQLELAREFDVNDDSTLVLPYLFEGHRIDQRLAARLLSAVLRMRHG